jgi:hypothetical protein
MGISAEIVKKPHVYFSSVYSMKQIKKLNLGISAEIDPGMKKPHVYFSSIYSMKQIKKLHLGILAEIDPGMKNLTYSFPLFIV